jgi:hypothetical protein
MFIGQLAHVLQIRMDFPAEMLTINNYSDILITHVFANGGLLWTFVLFCSCKVLQ